MTNIGEQQGTLRIVLGLFAFLGRKSTQSDRKMPPAYERLKETVDEK